MELNTLKQFFFKGTQEDVESFCSNLRPRLLRESVMREIDGIPTLLLVYAVDGVTKYIDSYMNLYMECTHCHQLELEQNLVHCQIASYQQKLREGSTRSRVQEEVLCTACYTSDFIFPEYGTDKYLYMDNEHTFKYHDENDNTFPFDDRHNVVPANALCVLHFNEDGSTLGENDLTNYHDRYHPSHVQTVYKNRLDYQILKSECTAPLWAQCSECGKWYWAADLRDGKCPECYQVKIYDYHHWDGDRVFKKLDSEDNPVMFFGTEVETEGGTRNSMLVAPYQDIWHLEHDGSLSNGFEMISQPMSWEYIKANEDRFKDMFNALSDAGQKSHDTNSCGFHIHVSRKAFDGKRAIDRCLGIVHGMRNQMMTFGRRYNNSFARFSDISTSPSQDEIDDINTYGHHVAINCGPHSDDNNSDTIEFRFPRGTLNYKTYLATIEFVKNIVEASNDTRMIVRFEELVHGDYIPEYVMTRENYHNASFNFDAKVSFVAYTLDESFKNVCTMPDSETAVQSFLSRLSSVVGRQIGFINTDTANNTEEGAA